MYLDGAAKRTLDRLRTYPPGGAPSLPNSLVVRHGKFYPAPPGLGSAAQSLMMSAVDHAASTVVLSAIGNGFSGLAGESVTAALARLTSNALARDILNMLGGSPATRMRRQSPARTRYSTKAFGSRVEHDGESTRVPPVSGCLSHLWSRRSISCQKAPSARRWRHCPEKFQGKRLTVTVPISADGV